MNSASDRQRQHYEQIHDEYERHYYDSTSQEFRRLFVEDAMFGDLDLNDADVADLACGSGHSSLSLLARFPRVRPVGFDISPRACAAYRSKVGRDCHELDLTVGGYSGPPFDAAMIHGGLHHCVSNLEGTLHTIAELLKPGGLLLMLEPNHAFMLEDARRLWYGVDHYFEAETEAALDHDRVLAQARDMFEAIDVRFRGGPAYFLIFNSLVFRIPPGLKPAIAGPLFMVERLYNQLRGRFWFAYFVARWRRLQ